MMPIQKFRLPEVQTGAKRATQRWRRVRLFIVTAVAAITLLSGTIAFGQASLNYDLACRSLLVSAGDISTSATYGVIGAWGLPMIPPRDSEINPTYAVRSITYGVRAGFLPGYPSNQTTAVATTSQQSAPALDEQALIQRLPIITKVLYIIRGGC